ncbi:MAG TPA: hypothetical protein VH540_06945 [Ktedonobacterales bacterium]|jgi:hypothetical protein
MAGISADLRTQIHAVLASPLDRSALLRQMSALAEHDAFRTHADLWAPALFQRAAPFFEPFLLRYLDARQEATIRALLPQAEAAGHDTLFNGLYQKIAREDAWNAELLVLARSHQTDEQVLRAIQRREMERSWFTMTEVVALTLYRRNPALFAAFIRRHIRHRWGQRSQGFEHLLQAIQQQGDDELYWALFRQLAGSDEWKRSIRQVLRARTPASAILEEVRRRHAEHIWDADTSVLIDVLERYGIVVIPYIEEHLGWIAQRGSAERLLSVVSRLGDEALYWRFYCKTRDWVQWNGTLRELLKRPISDSELALALEIRTPPSGWRWQWWRLESDVALSFYRRNPDLFRPMLERFATREPDLTLFHEAEQRGDEELLDTLSFRLMEAMQGLIYSAYPPPSTQRWRKPHNESQQRLAEYGALLTRRFDRLYARSPQIYLRHAASIMSRFQAFRVWSFQKNLAYNPAFRYLFWQHRAAWRQSSEGMRDLLESPNIYVQILGLEILAEGATDAAPRVIENLPLLRALLLGRAKLSTKRKALGCLQQAALQGNPFASQILPVLEEALHFQGKRAIDERLMVAFVRLRKQLAAEQNAS